MTVTTRTCARCSAELPEGALFCPRCGATTPATFTGAPGRPTIAPDVAATHATQERLQAALGASYVVGECIGVGGFAQVFAAYDTRLKRDVAVKVLRHELTGNTAFGERFRREAEAVARLRHPGIISIYAVGDEGGVAYFVMPRISGTTLAAALETETHWSFAEVCRVLREASSSLAEAHRLGLVHRDVKPENIMLDGPDRRVVIMDFGIAKLADPLAGSLTATGMMIGSPQYMSPEQAMGEPKIDHLSDQYSLALVGYRMLAGRLPFEASSARSLLYQQATQAPARLNELRPDIPTTLAVVIERAMSKERDKRFVSMGAFGDALAGVAREVAGEFRQRRVVPPLAERWSSTMTVLLDRPWRYPAIAAVALVAFIVAYPKAESSAARQAAGARDSAIAAARSTTTRFGAGTNYAERTVFVNNLAGHRYLQSALSVDSADRLARTLPIWLWDVSLYRGNPQDSWWAQANGDGRVISFDHILPDTARRPTVSPDSALAAARRLLALFGWHASDLQLVRQSTYARLNRVDHGFVWSVAGTAVRRTTDSAFTELSVTVAGGEPVSYREYLRLPPDYVPSWKNSTRQSFAGLGLAMVMSLALTAIGIALRRSPHDALQWGMGIRFGVAAGVAWLATNPLPRLREATVPFFTGDVSRVGMALRYVTSSMLNPDMIGTVVSITLLLVVAESLLNEGRPGLLAGMSDVARGRWTIPELVRSLPAGYALGLSGAALIAIASSIQRHAFGVPAETSFMNTDGAFSNSYPELGVLVSPRIALLATAIVMFLNALALRWRRPMLAPVVATIIWFCFAFATSGAAVPHITTEAVVVGLLTWVGQRHGAIVALLAMAVAISSPVIANFFMAGGPFVSAAVAGLALYALPIGFALLAYRRRPRIQSASATGLRTPPASA